MKRFFLTVISLSNLPWTIIEVDALEAGMHSLNPKGGGRVAQVYIVVEYT